MHTNHFSAEIFVDDIPAKEYNVETDELGDTSKAECYIQADGGAKYAVSIATHQYDALVSAWVIIDGKVCHKGLLNKENSTNMIEGRKISKHEFQPFVFAPIHTVEDGSSQNVQEAGTIKVEFRAARIVQIENADYIVDGSEQTEVNEKAKKGALISHVT
ncbi:hypothetical protein HK097_003960 [Rhizophlyctis rosea]|uniref:DUF7918 domain-containing protein n=1 Tax=Rhizophlyctis rosea TaxID=64517 RepID=A0AAD5S241_9FUNG|nr:hypothetical protein HK097_003960 [Rhizophlyctis rosea]